MSYRAGTLAAFVVLLAWSGCARVARTGRDRSVLTGVPQSFGEAPGAELEWDFGDGSPRERGAKVTHAFGRAGRYLVVGRRGDQPIERFDVQVAPRPVWDAIPSAASAALYVPALGGGLESVVDFLERVAGADAAQRWLDGTVLPALAMELSASGSGVLDGNEGAAIFLLDGFEGVVEVLGVVEDGAALRELEGRWVARGGEVLRDGERSFVGVRDDRLVGVFADQGYAYAVLADPGATPSDIEKAIVRVFEATRSEGLATPGWEAARVRLPAGSAYLYAPAFDGVLLVALAFSSNGLEVSGVVEANGPLWGEVDSERAASMLSSAPEGPIVAARLSLPPVDMARLVGGAAGTARRAASLARFRSLGVDGDELLSSLGGEAAGLLYFDAESFYDNLLRGNEKPEPRGAFLLETSLRRPEPAGELFAGLLEQAELRFDRIREGQTLRLRTRLWDRSAEVEIGRDRLRFTGGTGADKRERVDLAKRLTERFGGLAFQPGHASIMLDVGRLRSELEVPRLIEGVDPRRFVVVQGFSVAFLNQLTAIDALFLDAFPEAHGARIRGRLTLRSRP